MSWRTFKFFEFEELKDPDTNQPYDKLKVKGVDPSSCHQKSVPSYTASRTVAKKTELTSDSFLPLPSTVGHRDHLLQLWTGADDLWRYPASMLMLHFCLQSNDS